MVDAVICCFGGFFLFVKANSRKIKWFCCVGFLFSCNQPLCWWIFKVFVVSIGMVAVLLLFTWTNSMQDLRSPRRLIYQGVLCWISIESLKRVFGLGSLRWIGLAFSHVKEMSGIICKTVVKKFWYGVQVDFSDKSDLCLT